jgi:hypothetical protein
MITLKTPIAQAQNKTSPDPLWEELSDESAASCGGGDTRWLPFSVGGKYVVWRGVPASWSPQQVYEAVKYVLSKQVPGQTRIYFIGVI